MVFDNKNILRHKRNIYRDSAAVHVLHEEVHLVGGDVPEEDGGMFAGVGGEQGAEVRTAGRQHQLVRRVGLGLSGQRHVAQLLVLVNNIF